MHVQGHHAPRFEPWAATVQVRGAGSALAVYHHGKPAVDVWVGARNRAVGACARRAACRRPLRRRSRVSASPCSGEADRRTSRWDRTDSRTGGDRECFDGSRTPVCPRARHVDRPAEPRLGGRLYVASPGEVEAAVFEVRLDVDLTGPEGAPQGQRLVADPQHLERGPLADPGDHCSRQLMARRRRRRDRVLRVDAHRLERL